MLSWPAEILLYPYLETDAEMLTQTFEDLSMKCIMFSVVTVKTKEGMWMEGTERRLISQEEE